MTVLLVCLVAALAFANGSNDNGKGVATLVGFGAARPWTALLYATATTAIGGIVSFWLAGGLLAGFSTGLFVKGTPITPAFFVAVLTLVSLFGAIVAAFTGRSIQLWLFSAMLEGQFALLFLFLGLIGVQIRAISDRTRGTPLVLERERVNFPPGY